MAKSSLGTLTVNILAKTAGIEQGTRKGRAAFRNLEKEVKQVEKAIGTSMKVAGAAVAGFAAATAYAVKQEMALIATQKDLAKSMNATVTGLRAVNMAAESNSIDGLDGSLARFTRRLGAVENGGGPAAAAVKALKLDVEQLGKVDADEKLALVADAIKNTGISSQQATRYLQDMGFEQRGIYNIFAEGGDSIRAYREQVEAYGLAVSEIDAEKIGIADSAFDTLGRTTQGLTTQLSVELSGILASSAAAFEDWAKSGEDGVSNVRKAVDYMIDAIAKTIDVLDSLYRIGEIVWKSMRAGVAVISAGVFKLADAIAGSLLGQLAKMAEFAAKFKLPGAAEAAAMLRSVSGGLAEMAAVSETVAVEAAAELATAISDGINAPLVKGEAFKSWVDDARKAGEEMAAAAVAGRQFNAEDDPIEQTRTRLSGELQALVDYQKEKEELLFEQYQSEQDLLNESLENNKISYEDYAQAMLNIDQKLKDGQKKLDQQTAQERFKGAASFFGNMSTLMNTESRKLFEIGKIASYAGAVVSGIEAAVSSFAFGAKLGGPALGASFAAASAAATGVQIAAIANTQFGGGTAAVSNTQAVNAVTEPVQQQAPVATQEIYLRGIDPNMMYDGAQVLEALNRQIEDGGRIVGVI